MEKIVIMVLITLTMGQAKDDLDTMKEMMAEMKMEMMAEMTERLSLAEGKLAKTEDQLAATKDELAATMGQAKDDLDTMREMMAEMTQRVANSEDELAITKDELAICKADHAITKARTDELEREVAILKAPPFIHSCGSHSDWLSGSYMTIPYTSLLYSSTNTEGGGLDITTGVFTAPHGGSYTVYWDTIAALNSGEDVQIVLQKNEETIDESRQDSQYTGPSGSVRDQGGRTMVVYLAMGDTLQLYRDYGNGSIVRTTFCVSLTTFDIV